MKWITKTTTTLLFFVFFSSFYQLSAQTLTGPLDWDFQLHSSTVDDFHGASIVPNNAGGYTVSASATSYCGEHEEMTWNVFATSAAICDNISWNVTNECVPHPDAPSTNCQFTFRLRIFAPNNKGQYTYRCTRSFTANSPCPDE